MDDEADDRALVAAVVARRDEAAFRALYRCHAPALFALAVRLNGGNRADAEDALQETWLRAGRSLAGFAWRSTLRTWLAGHVVNCTREIRRRTRETRPLDDADRIARPFEDASDVERVLATLPDGYREVLTLHDVMGFTHEEIGRMLAIDPGTSKSQLSRGREALRARLSGLAPVKGRRL